MAALAKLIIAIFVTLTINSTNVYEFVEANSKLTEKYASNYALKDPKERAFEILKIKCNVCHRKRNKRHVFTLENMSPMANDIYKQVFIKKRMPKGKKIKLAYDEYQDLLTWVSSNKNKEQWN